MRSRLLRSTIITLGLTVLTVTGSLRPAQAKDTWIKVQSKNFTLVGNASEKDVRLVATRLEQFRDVMIKLLSKAEFNSPVPITVVVFKSTASYKPFNPGNYAGYFQKGPDVNYVTLTADSGPGAFNIIYHEYVHIMLNNMIRNVPDWFNEGLAEYYSTFLIEDDRKVHVGELIPDHLQTLRHGKLYPLRTLFAVNHESPEFDEGKKRGMFYAESWALVHYLMLGNNGQRVDQLGKYLELIAANTSIDEAFKLAFKTDLESLEKELKRYVESETFRVQFATFHKKLEFDQELKSLALSDAEAEGYLGDLLLHTNDLAGAETHLRQATLLDPHLIMAQTALGMVRIRQERFFDAKKALAEAVTDPSSNYLTHYFYAYALSKEGVGPLGAVSSYPAETIKIMRAELKRAIELNPAYPDAHYLLSMVNTVAGDALDEAVESLKTAIKLAPARQELLVELGQLYLRVEKYDLAIQTLQPLRNSQDSSLKKQAEILIQSIERLQKLAAERNVNGKSEAPAESSSPRPEPGAVAVNNSGQAAPRSESDELLEMLRTVKPGERRIQGTFAKLDCDSKAVAYFNIQAGDGLHRIRAAVLDNVVIRTFIPSPQEMACGLRKNPENVVLTYRLTTNPADARARIEGDAVAVELMPKD